MKHTLRAAILALFTAASFPAAGVQAGARAPTALQLPRPLPSRSLIARGGSEFADETADLDPEDRQAAAVYELSRGNFPELLRHLKPVHLRWAPEGRAPLEATINVMPDYLAVGSDLDSLRIPLNYAAATQVANKLGFLLPTPRMVDAIYQQAAIRLTPAPLYGGAQVGSVTYYLRHREMTEAQRQGRRRGALTAGHKKDVVLTNRLAEQGDRIALYGGHRPDGTVIQPLSLSPGGTSVDYGQGVRLISPTVFINGEPLSLAQSLEDPALAGLFTDEGCLKDVQGLMRPGRLS